MFDPIGVFALILAVLLTRRGDFRSDARSRAALIWMYAGAVMNLIGANTLASLFQPATTSLDGQSSSFFMAVTLLLYYPPLLIGQILALRIAHARKMSGYRIALWIGIIVSLLFFILRTGLVLVTWSGITFS